ncbi:MAG: hypothetical protein LBV32_01810 [Tannerellaceae bacterium]|nr:hypothetical protein [Tannerellaceae bacterium]
MAKHLDDFFYHLDGVGKAFSLHYSYYILDRLKVLLSRWGGVKIQVVWGKKQTGKQDNIF